MRKTEQLSYIRHDISSGWEKSSDGGVSCLYKCLPMYIAVVLPTLVTHIRITYYH